jgi:hypothetical protein
MTPGWRQFIDVLVTEVKLNVATLVAAAMTRVDASVGALRADHDSAKAEAASELADVRAAINGAVLTMAAHREALQADGAAVLARLGEAEQHGATTAAALAPVAARTDALTEAYDALRREATAEWEDVRSARRCRPMA